MHIDLDEVFINDNPEPKFQEEYMKKWDKNGREVDWNGQVIFDVKQPVIQTNVSECQL